MKTKLGLLIMVLAVFFVYEEGKAQAPSWAWAKVIGSHLLYGHSEGLCTSVDVAGNVYTTGFFQGTVDFDPGPGVFNLTVATNNTVYISKLDAAGNFTWAKTWPNSRGNFIAIDQFNNIYITGHFVGTVDFDPGPAVFNLSSPTNDGFVSKFDSSGNFLWATAIGETTNGTSIDASAMAIDSSGNIYTTGIFNGPADFDPGPGVLNLLGNWYISKLNSSGNLVWAHAMGGNKGTSIAVDALGNVYACGYFDGTADFDPGPGTYYLTAPGFMISDMFILKLGSSGNFLWATIVQGNSTTNSWCNDLALDALGNVYTVGTFYCMADFDPGSGVFNLTATGANDIFILKLDGSGNFIWVKAMGGNGEDEGYSIVLDPSGNIYTTGSYGAYGSGPSDFDPGPGIFNLTTVNQRDIFISKLDNSGNFVWAKGMGGTRHDYGSSIALNPSGDAYITGYFRSPFISFDSYGLTNLDTSGNTFDILIAKLDATTGITELNTTDNRVSIYPKPSTGQITISSSKNIDEVTITNPLGQVIYAAKPKDKNLSLQIKDDGIYFVTITSDKRTSTQKIIVQH